MFKHLFQESSSSHNLINSSFIVDDNFHLYQPSQTYLDQFAIAKRTIFVTQNIIDMMKRNHISRTKNIVAEDPKTTDLKRTMKKLISLAKSLKKGTGSNRKSSTKSSLNDYLSDSKYVEVKMDTN